MTKRRRRVAGGLSAATVVGLLTGAFKIYDDYEARQHERKAALNQVKYECAVDVCEARGGRWIQGECEGARPE